MRMGGLFGNMWRPGVVWAGAWQENEGPRDHVRFVLKGSVGQRASHSERDAGDVDRMEHGPLPTDSPGHWPVWLSESGGVSSSCFWLPRGLRDLSSPTRG